jgi:hypothetical protein
MMYTPLEIFVSHHRPVRSYQPSDDDGVIYALVDPRDETVRYIGKESVPFARYDLHVGRRSPSPNEPPSPRKVAGWIDGLKRLNLSPFRYEVLRCPQAQLDLEETRAIAWGNALGRLLNVHGGGRWCDEEGYHSMKNIIPLGRREMTLSYVRWSPKGEWTMILEDDRGWPFYAKVPVLSCPPHWRKANRDWILSSTSAIIGRPATADDAWALASDERLGQRVVVDVVPAGARNFSGEEYHKARIVHSSTCFSAVTALQTSSL